ncbi:hypothetical protein Salpa_0323 [Sporomusa sp. KB1]|jgi:hypothetical protein|nr:hypothetical protein Salpa_0323 [Sporomusa sp. KB1]
MELTFILLLSLIISMMFVLFLGLYSARKVKSADDFSIGSRSSGVTIVSGTIVGTIIGGAATMGTAQLAFCVGVAEAGKHDSFPAAAAHRKPALLHLPTRRLFFCLDAKETFRVYFF